MAPGGIGQAFWVNSAFIILPLILAQDARAYGFLVEGLALLPGAVAVVPVIASIWKRSLMKLLTWRWGTAGAIAYGFGIFIFLSVYFPLEGAADAARFIEGRSQPSSSVVLLTGDPASPVNGKRLLVALTRDGDFSLVRQEVPAPTAPHVYFVPASEVRTATMQRTGSTTATPIP